MNQYYTNKFGDKVEKKPIHFACNSCKEDQHKKCNGERLIVMESSLRPGEPFITIEEAAWNCYCFRHGHKKRENDEAPTELPKEFVEAQEEIREEERKYEEKQTAAKARITDDWDDT